ncbi:hypothetical protein [Streptomyces sp. NPDC055013]
MANSAAAAVLTSADLPEVMGAVRTLPGIADIGQGEVDFEAVIRSPDVLKQVRHVLPDLKWWALAGEQHGSPIKWVAPVHRPGGVGAAVTLCPQLDGSPMDRRVGQRV